ncbi:hypothetical protein D3C86_1965640 [compost metagenome]
MPEFVEQEALFCVQGARVARGFLDGLLLRNLDIRVVGVILFRTLNGLEQDALGQVRPCLTVSAVFQSRDMLFKGRREGSR